MNGNAINSIAATFALLAASLWVAFDIFTSGGNAVARSYMYLMGAGGIYGLLNPRRAFYALLFLTAYLDYFKRLMIFDSALSRMDLYFVLGRQRPLPAFHGPLRTSTGPAQAHVLHLRRRHHPPPHLHDRSQ